MFVALRLISLPAARRPQSGAIIAELRAAMADMPGVSSCWIAPVLEGVAINAGQIVWRMEFQTEREAQAIQLDPQWSSRVAPLLHDAEITTVGYCIAHSAVRAVGSGIWRALIFRVRPEGFPDAAKALEAGLLLFPKYIPAIRSWALSNVSTIEGPKAFTHVWEQEFDSVVGLTKDYMVSPLHWGVVDAWFDAESPDYVVDPQLIQVVGQIDKSIMH